MPYREEEKQRNYQKSWYQRNKAAHNRRNKEYRAEMRLLVIEKKNVPCEDCGGFFPPYVMDLDHRDPALKVEDVSVMVRRYGKKRLLEELEKCGVVCANCHRIREHEKRGRT